MPGPSPSREESSPLNLGVRAGIYGMLAALVVASFVVTPERRTPAAALPVTAEPETTRAVPMARGFVRPPRDVEDVLLAASPPPIPEPAAEPVVYTTSVTDPQSQAFAEATPEPTPEPTPVPPTPRPATPRPATPRPATLPPVAAPVVPATALTTAAELRMLALMNTSRAQSGLLPLAMDPAVANVARAHSTAESQVRYVYHDGPDGTAKSRNVPACGNGWYGENTGKIWNNNVDALHIEFMAEPWEPINHRTNIMDPAFRRVGVGAVIGPDAMYMTMVFCR